MYDEIKYMSLVAVGAIAFIGLCSRLLRNPQRKRITYIREPKINDFKERWAYDREEWVCSTNEEKEFWVYAKLCHYVYDRDHIKKYPLPFGWEEIFSSRNKSTQIQPSVRYSVFVKKYATFPIIAVVFRGTESLLCREGWKDWKANLRFFLNTYNPEYLDRYISVEREAGKQVIKQVEEWKEKPNNNISNFKLVAAGHSLGGGLAQYFAYTLPKKNDFPRVSNIYAFNSSPVTAWSDVEDRTLRDNNDQELDKIFSVFEHGEILAYIRWFLCWNTSNTAHLWTYRYNFLKSMKVIFSHSILEMANQLSIFRDWAAPNRKVEDAQRLVQLQLIYDYIKFHIGLYTITPAILVILAQGLCVQHEDFFKAGMLVMIVLYVLAGMHAAWFMGNHVNQRWHGDFLDEFQDAAFSPFRRFMHHWFYWAGVTVGLAGIIKSSLVANC